MMDPELKQALAGLEGRLNERLEATETKLLAWFHKHALTNEI
jgi:hypothetical protein